MGGADLPSPLPIRLPHRLRKTPPSPVASPYLRGPRIFHKIASTRSRSPNAGETSSRLTYPSASDTRSAPLTSAALPAAMRNRFRRSRPLLQDPSSRFRTTLCAADRSWLRNAESRSDSLSSTGLIARTTSTASSLAWNAMHQAMRDSYLIACWRCVRCAGSRQPRLAHVIRHGVASGVGDVDRSRWGS